MKFLHTSDWHLGRSFHKYSTQEEQETFCQNIINIVKDEHIDVVLVAGDVYDRTTPPLESMRLYDKTIEAILNAGAQIFMISGNHDNRIRLGNLKGLLEKAGLHLRTKISDIDKPLMLKDAHGHIAVYGIPYLNPMTDKDALNVDKVSPIEVTRAATELIAADLAQRGTPRSIVLSHAFVSGGEASDSERDISIGGIDNVPTSLFEHFSYTALGHLHGQQNITDTVRYSGTPMPYSFSEANQKKGYWLFELNEKGLGEIISIPSTDFRKLRIISGTMDELLESNEFDDAQDAWVQITIKQEERPSQAYDQLKTRFPFLCELKFNIAKEQRDMELLDISASNAENPVDVVIKFVDYVQEREANEMQKKFIKQAVDEVTHKNAA